MCTATKDILWSIVSAIGSKGRTEGKAVTGAVSQPVSLPFLSLHSMMTGSALSWGHNAWGPPLPNRGSHWLPRDGQEGLSALGMSSQGAHSWTEILLPWSLSLLERMCLFLAIMWLSSTFQALRESLWFQRIFHRVNKMQERDCLEMAQVLKKINF